MYPLWKLTHVEGMQALTDKTCALAAGDVFDEAHVIHAQHSSMMRAVWHADKR